MKLVKYTDSFETVVQAAYYLMGGPSDGELYDATIKRIDNIKLAGYDIIYIWENEFDEMGT